MDLQDWTLVAAPFVFAALAFVTRALLPRSALALATGVVFALGNVGWDVLAYHEHWWWYPETGNRGYAPLTWYVAAGFLYGGAGLIGWRVRRAFGLVGLAAFLVVFALYGLQRDWIGSRTAYEDVITFGSGATPWLADYAGWFTLMAVVQAIHLTFRGDSLR